MAAGVPTPGARVGLAVSRFPRMDCRSKQGRIVACDANPPERNRRTAGKASLIYATTDSTARPGGPGGKQPCPGS